MLFRHLGLTRPPNGRDYRRLKLEFKLTCKTQLWTDLTKAFAKSLPGLLTPGEPSELLDLDDGSCTSAESGGSPSSCPTTGPSEAQAVPAKEVAPWLLPEVEREEIISFFIRTMKEIGLDSSLAQEFFSAGMFRALPSHLTVPGVARRLVSGKHLEHQASEGDEDSPWKELDSVSDFKHGLLGLGFQPEVAEQWATGAEGRSLMYFQHKGLLQVAFDLIDLRLHCLAAGDFGGDPSTDDEPEDGQGGRQQRRNQSQAGGSVKGQSRDDGGSGRRAAKKGGDDEGNEQEEKEGAGRGDEDIGGPCPKPVPECILLYHGTTEEYALDIMENIDLAKGKGWTDFARSGGFYLGDCFHQAKKWATETTAEVNNMTKSARPHEPKLVRPAVLVYAIRTSWLNKQKVWKFEIADDEWKKFVFANRAIDPLAQPPKHKYSIVIGPALANPKHVFASRNWKKAGCLKGFTQYALVKENVALEVKAFFLEWHLKDSGTWAKAPDPPAGEDSEGEADD